MIDRVEILPVRGLGEFAEGDDIAAAICARAEPADGDIVVVAQKIVSKVEGRTRAIDPSDPVAERARIVAGETAEVVARRGDLVIVRTHHGYVCAHAGVDASNASPGEVILLPEDPDASAATIRARIRDLAGADVAVIVSDTFGRPWRVGQTNVALGVAGMPAVRDHRGEHDPAGMTLEATIIAVADEVAGAAELVMRKIDRVPVAIVRGLDARGRGSGRDLIRPADEDLFARGDGAGPA